MFSGTHPLWENIWRTNTVTLNLSLPQCSYSSGHYFEEFFDFSQQLYCYGNLYIKRMYRRGPANVQGNNITIASIKGIPGIICKHILLLRYVYSHDGSILRDTRTDRLTQQHSLLQDMQYSITTLYNWTSFCNLLVAKCIVNVISVVKGVAQPIKRIMASLSPDTYYPLE